MLKSIDPIPSPDLLSILRSMGHGDEIVIADANFPAASMAQRLIRPDGLTATAVADAVLSVMPLDDFVAEAALRMEVAGDPTTEQPIFEFRRIIADREGTRFLPRRFGTVRVLRARMERLRDRPHWRDTPLRQHHPEEGRAASARGLQGLTGGWGPRLQ
jgi:L-fucose mutarotase